VPGLRVSVCAPGLRIRLSAWFVIRVFAPGLGKRLSALFVS